MKSWKAIAIPGVLALLLGSTAVLLGIGERAILVPAAADGPSPRPSADAAGLTTPAPELLGVGESGAREPRVPAERIDLDPRISTLRLRFVFRGKPAQGVKAHLEHQGEHRTAISNKRGEVRFRVVAGLEYDMLAERRGVFGSKRLAVSIGDRELEHQHIVELEPAPLATVSIVVHSVPDMPIDRGRFVFEPIEKSSRARAFTRLVPDRAAQQEIHLRLRFARSQLDADGQPIPEDVHVALAPSQDRFDLLHVPSGRYRVIAQLGNPLSNNIRDDPAHVFDHCDSEVIIDVPDSGVVRTTIEATRRPRVIVVVRSRAGAQLAASCTLRDGKGTVLEPFLIVENQQGWWRSERLDAKLPTQVYSKLCAGPCELELAHEGYFSRTVPVVLEAGESSVVYIVLEPE